MPKYPTPIVAADGRRWRRLRGRVRVLRAVAAATGRRRRCRDLARKNWPLSQSSSSIERMMVAGAFIAKMENLAIPQFQRAMGMTDLLIACHTARAEAAKVKTGLFGLRPEIAARVVASGYLNDCLNAHGPSAFEIADRGISILSERLGSRARLDQWWQTLTPPDRHRRQQPGEQRGLDATGEEM